MRHKPLYPCKKRAYASAAHLYLFALTFLTSCANLSPFPGDNSVDCPLHEPTRFRTALSVSPFSEFVLSRGVVFTDGKRRADSLQDLQEIYVHYGATEIYARVSTSRNDPVGIADRSLRAGIERARLAHSLGLKFNPEISLFGSYGDILCQTPPDFSEYPEIDVPADWYSLTLEQMKDVLRQYGKFVAEKFLETEADILMWNIGNEVDFGTAGVSVQPAPGACDDEMGGANWYQPPHNINPEIATESVLSLMQMSEDDRIAWLSEHLWPYTAQLKAATAEGIKSVDPEARFSTHISLSNSPDFAVAFYTAMIAGGFDPDEPGLSFYPSAGGGRNRLKSFQETVQAIHDQFGRQVFIAEYAYPAETPSVGPFASWDHELPDYPMTEKGQAALLVDLVNWGTSTGMVSGIRPWGPDLVIPGHPLWEPFALFALDDRTARARPGICALPGDP